MTDDTVRIFVGAHEGERLPFEVLRHSICRHTPLDVEMRTVDNSLVPAPSDPRFIPYTNFSYGRFAIPKLAGYRGRAIYLDSDMIVFRDIGELWNTPFEGAAILIERVTGSSRDVARRGAVQLLDCAKLDWDPERIVARLGIDYDYDELMSLRPLLTEDGLADRLPLGWNSLDERHEHTRLLHYTRIRTQPWVCPSHPLGPLWVEELERMLDTGAMDASLVHAEVERGHIRPSLLAELGLQGGSEPRPSVRDLERLDREAGYVAHRDLLAAIARRKRALLAHQESLDPVGFRRRRRLRRLRRLIRHPIRFVTDPDRRL